MSGVVGGYSETMGICGSTMGSIERGGKSVPCSAKVYRGLETGLGSMPGGMRSGDGRGRAVMVRRRVVRRRARLAVIGKVYILCMRWSCLEVMVDKNRR